MSNERIEAARGEWEQDGYWLTIDTDDGTHTFRITDTAAARELVAAAAPLASWAEEEARQRAAYDRATPQERARVLGEPAEPCGHDGWQAGCEQCEENARVAADYMRKAEREGA